MEKINPQKQSELYIICAGSRQELLEKLKVLIKFLELGNAALADASGLLSSSIKKGQECLSIVCTSADELRKKSAYAVQKLAEIDCSRIYEKSGIYYFGEKLAQKGKLAFLFPGEGSQYQNMLCELSLYFPEVRRSFEIADAACSAVDGFLPSQYIFPAKDRENELEQELWKMEGAVEAVVSANYAMMMLLKKLKIIPDCLVGHSSGEFTALEQAQVIQFEDERSRIEYIREGYVLMKELTAQTDIPEGILVAIGAVKRKEIESAIKEISSPIFIAMENCSHQYVLCGCRDSIEKIVALLSKQGAICNILPFNRPYHTAWFEQALKPLKNFFDRHEVFAPKIEIYSCATVAPYPTDPKQIRSVATGQWAMPVRFQETIETIYENGVRVLIEVGPRGNLTGFVDNILKDKAHIAVPLDKIHHSGIAQLNHALGLLAAAGVEMELDYFYSRKPLTFLDRIDAREEGNRHTIPSMRLAGMSFKSEFSQKLHLSTSESKPTIAVLEGTASVKEKGSSQEVLDSYFKTMENFVAVSSDIMHAYLEGEMPQMQAGQEKAAAGIMPHKFPLLGEILELKASESLIAMREFTLEEDLFLKDHTFGTSISSLDPGLKALSILPLTVSIEILAEAASLLLPEKILIGMENIRAYKWISFETAKASLQIKAEYSGSCGSEKVFVEIRQAGPSKNEAGNSLSSLLAEGTAVFRDTYPPSPCAVPISFKNESGCNLSGPEIYPKRLFHGPLFQPVKSITRWGDDGFEGTIQALPRTELFRSNSKPDFVTDPVLLDGMGSLLGLWAAREACDGFVFFPFQVKAIHFFKPNIFPPGEKMKFQLRVLKQDKITVVSDIDLIGENSAILARMEGWEDRNFYFTKPLHRLFLQPIENTLSSPLTVLEEKFSGNGKFAFCILDGFPDDFFQSHHKIWEKMLAFLIFSKEERQRWQSMGENEKLRIQHLLGRAALKDAVRLYLVRHCGLKLGPADIIIENDKMGKPFVTGQWIDKAGEILTVSISHTGTAVVAACTGGSGRSIGIDVEDSNNLNDDLLAGAFSEEERKLASSINSHTFEWLAKFWCAKEAFCKALGSGMVCSPKDIVIKAIEDKTGKLLLEARQGWIKEFPFLEGKKIEAYASARGNLAIAACLLLG